MSDEDDDLRYVKRQKIVHYGSLADATGAARTRQQEEDDEDDEDGPGGPNSNIEISHEYLPLNRDERLGEKDEILEEFERRKRARLINVSTDDAQVKKDLRALGRPICYFGEGPAERRHRLRDLLSQLGEDAIQKRQEAEDARAKEQREHDETTWYHEGPPALRDARQAMATYSLPRARARIGRQKVEAEMAESARMARNQEIQRNLKALDLEASQIADTRPISWCQFSPDSKMLATGSWSGLCKVWSVPDCEEVITLRGHNDHIGNVTFNPLATVSLAASGPNLASCDSQGEVNVWSLESSQPLIAFPNLEARVSRVQFHPMGRHLAACAYDNSWRLFDLETRDELLHQEGHSKAVHCIAFQNDGALACTGGVDSFGRVWDMRTGQCIMFLEGHLKGIVCVDWSMDGYHIITGSTDNSCRVWDLRRRNKEYTIPAHNNVVSNVVFEKSPRSEYILTSSFDGTAKLWASKTWQHMATLKGHDSRLMGCDIAADGSFVATCSYDRTFKLWTSKS
eukprot:snap_masked-scaffold57_size444674-processed-gene-0.3 protein:Tk04353 transcript:snap_masked-scaffold57_size444674-processed-gene-0.3-mRNA-1 annotation:"u4 u6 small nuclear ribonucleoprotein"